MERPTRPGEAGERGVTLVGLVMIVTVLSIFVAATIPLWSSRIQRDREEELISRGFQYAEAIRIFQKRFGRLPNRLDELVKIEPRSIRRLWKDPMTEDGAWGVIVELPGVGLIALDSRTGQPLVPIDKDGDGEPDPLPVPPPSPREEEGGPALGPIHGVRSRAHGDAFQTLFDKDDFGEWEFTIEMIQTAVAKPGPSGLPPRNNALTLGRPFRYPPPGGVPGGGSPPRPGSGGQPPRQPGGPRGPGAVPMPGQG